MSRKREEKGLSAEVPSLRFSALAFYMVMVAAR
jgi:hypothetical protein